MDLILDLSGPGLLGLWLILQANYILILRHWRIGIYRRRSPDLGVQHGNSQRIAPLAGDFARKEIINAYCSCPAVAGLLICNLRKVIAPKTVAIKAARPPNARPQRAPATSANQPTMGPPMVVEPRKAIVQKDMTRPRICGALVSCKVLLPSEEKLIEQIPTKTRTSL